MRNVWVACGNVAFVMAVTVSVNACDFQGTLDCISHGNSGTCIWATPAPSPDQTVMPSPSSSPLTTPVASPSSKPSSTPGMPSPSPVSSSGPSPSSLPTIVPSATPANSTPTPSSQTPIGINLDSLKDYGSIVFADAWKSVRGHSKNLTAPFDAGDSVPVDQDGWPTQDFSTLVFTDLNPADTTGLYSLSFDGTATVTAFGSNAKVMTCIPSVGTVVTLGLSTQHWTCPVTVNGGSLNLAFKGSTNGVKNIKLIRPGHSENDLFYKPFLAALAPFRVIRYMDLLRTNTNQVTDWSTRTKPTYSHYNLESGIPPEMVVELANQTGKDIWYNLPVRATDDYVQNLAALFKAKLNPGIKVYLEVGNELWNWAYPFKVQVQANIDIGKAELAAGDRSLMGDDTTQNDFYVGQRRLAKRLVTASQMIAQAIGKERVRPVLAGQVANPQGNLRIALAYIAKNYGPPKDVIYGIAGAPYFSTKWVNQVPMNGQYIQDGLFNSVENKVKESYKADVKWDGKSYTGNIKAIADFYGLRVLQYEGGPDTGGSGVNDQALVSFKADFNRQKAMGDLIRRNYQLWFGCGGSEAMYFAGISGTFVNPHGSWLLTESFKDIASSEKYKAVKEIAESKLSDLQATPCVSQPLKNVPPVPTPTPKPTATPQPSATPGVG